MPSVATSTPAAPAMTDFTEHLRVWGTVRGSIKEDARTRERGIPKKVRRWQRSSHGTVLVRGQRASILTPPMPPSTSAGRILIVEDDPDIAHLLSHSLSRAGFGVDSLSSGHEVMIAIR